LFKVTSISSIKNEFKERGRLSGLFSPLIGSYLYKAYSPQMAFVAAASLSILGTVIFSLTVKEPKEKQV